ncbi:MAG TPA: hypothetical protein VF660_03750, partial [Actinomycetota bacterium]
MRTEIEDTRGLLWRVDPLTGEAKSLSNTRGAEEPAFGEGYAWVTRRVVDGSGEASLLKLDPATGDTVASIAIPPWPFTPVVGFGSVWIPTHDGLA